MSSNRLLVIVFLGAALLLLRTGATERAEIPEGGSAIEWVFCDDAAVPAPATSVQPALVILRGAVIDRPDTRAGRLFVSEIFRPPMAPLARSS